MFFAGFWDGRAFEKTITDIAPKEFLNYMNLYNTGWVVAHLDISKNYLEKLREATLTGEYMQIRTYKIKRELNSFLEGTGRIEKQLHNQLTVSDLSGDPVILKYYFFHGMKSEPDATLIPVKIMDDPVPFIKIINPFKNIRVYLH